MTPPRIFFFTLCCAHLVGLSLAIYDPRATTTKPPVRREPILPWYLAGNQSHPPDDPSRSAKWSDPDYPRQPRIISSASNGWTPWAKSPDGQIEQRTETDDARNFDQSFEQIEGLRPPDPDPPSSYRGNTHFYGDYANMAYLDFENKLPSKDRGKLHVEVQMEDNLYEGIGSDSKKPRKEKILLSEKPKLAKYDIRKGVQCPDPHITGQFVYPPDCKFFVNCWQGRAFVQPCAPGTLFNPETMECDFPHKVRCYGGELVEFQTAAYTDTAERKEPLIDGGQLHHKGENLQEPRCPPHITGMMPHPTDCAKFLQCSNGGTIVMNCGPGTVFNPAISVCDWPRNVRGCEEVDTAASKNDDFVDSLVPPNPHPHESKHQYGPKADYKDLTAARKPKCPAGYTGLLPHPDTCKKFLQCTNGGTFVMDCGPGTAFNPETTVCDWPYNVPGCSEEKPRGTSNSGSWKYTTTTAKPVPPRVPTWGPFSGSIHDGREKPDQYGYNPNQDSSNENRRNYNPNQQLPDENTQNYHPDQQYSSTQNRGIQNNSHRGINGNHWNNQQPDWNGQNNDQWLKPDSEPNFVPPSNINNNNNHHHHQHNHDWSSSDPNYSPNGGEHLHPHYHHHHQHHHNHHHFPGFNGGAVNDEFPHNHDHHRVDDESQHWDQSNFSNPSDSEPSGTQDVPRLFESSQGLNQSNRKREEHGRSLPDFLYPFFNKTPSSDGNIYVDSSYKLPEELQGSSQVQGSNADNKSENRTFWSQAEMPGNQSGVFKPSTWRGIEEGNQNPNQSQGLPWNQDEPPFPVYYIPPVQPLTTDKPSRRLTPISGQFIRLRGGTGPRDGYVEVQGSRPGWGIVCDSKNRWTLKEAHVVCRQLGYPRGAEMAWQGRTNKTDIPIWIAANSVDCLGNETRFQACRFKHEQECRVERDAIGVRCLANRVAHCQKDEIAHEGQCYHLAGPDTGLNHAEALEYCANRGSQLIDILSQPENNFVSEWLLQVYPEVTSIMTSGVGFTTFNRTLWLWEDASRAKFRFAKWWPGWMADKKEMPWVGSRPVCVVIKRNFPCHDRPDSICLADYYFWDVEDCATSTKGHSYICKKPYEDIGCIYGKGNQYVGKANVTMSGKECLSWGNDVVAHPLTVQVPNRDVRDSLKSHNYCRNPNPIKESRPWCFIGEYGRREYCDIPACGKIEQKRTQTTGQCKPKHFECSPGECIPAPWVCDGEEDCTNGADEKTCRDYLNLFKKSAKQRLTGYDVEKWLNTPLKTCALRCKEADFTCRSFAHKAEGNVCLLSDSNVGMTGALEFSKDFNYYEMKDRSINCDGMFVCGNRKCINQTQVCDGKNDCHDRTDESLCTVENLDYDIRLAGAESTSEGRVEVKILGVWGQVCDDNFGIINADVICKELGYVLGALEVRPGGYYGNMDPPTRFMVDQLKCRGNETSLRECDFEGWGVHNCQPEEAVGVVCKTAVDSCQEGHWKCDNSPVCIPTPFICDEVVDCDDHSDESPEHCEAPFEIRLANGSNPMEGRVEVRHHGIWGTVCDDDFTNATAKVICRSLGYGGIAIAKKNGYFGPGHGPIWLDEVFCHGNESQLYRCEHNHWGQHNCDHEEDAGVICSPGDVNDPQPSWNTEPEVAEVSIDDLLPAHCGKRAEDFDMNEDMIFEKVVRGSVAPKGSYPWQASIRVRGHSRSSHWCGAVVISPLHVLTAAHCLEGYNKGTYFVRAGDYNTDIEEGTEVEANIEDYYIHEDFRKGHRMNNDIALVLLKGRGIPLGKDVMPICLPVENTEYSAGLNCTISGFGSIETGKTTQSRNLRYGWIPLLDQSVCRAGYIYGQGAISDGMVCAGHLDEGVDTCDGDSGGPLACHHNGAFTLYGITSWGQHCGKANKPGVYVRVAHYRRWIDEKIRDSMAGR
ncbi:uncharacterized protein teq isoform X5 [Prorops nasuta]|uniref:uncharacterized protein teq isoform X5 n=1 Tax=Prorops nasuta TaxID=863751 RepID=UPI0034CD44C3